MCDLYIFIAFLLGVFVSTFVITLVVIRCLTEYCKEPKLTLKDIWKKLTHFNP